MSMEDISINKVDRLREILRSLESALICYSGGVDSTYLLKMALVELGVKNAVGLLVKSAFYPARILSNARCVAEDMGVKIVELDVDVMLIPGIRDNPPNRCYHCKREIYQAAFGQAKKLGLKHVIDGTIADDLFEDRPGLKAAEELGIRKPLAEAELTKKEIRAESKKLGLPNWDSTSYTCLATRFPPGTGFDPDRLEKVARCEEALRDERFKLFRARYHGDTVRIELDQSEFPRLFNKDRYKRVVGACKQAGFKFVSLDLEGYRFGSMAEASTDNDDKK